MVDCKLEYGRIGYAWREIHEGESVGEANFVQEIVSGELSGKALSTATVYELQPKIVNRFLALNSLLETKFWKILCQHMAIQIKLHLESQCPGVWCTLAQKIQTHHNQSFKFEHGALKPPIQLNTPLLAQ